MSNILQIQINTDHDIEGREARSAPLREVVERALNHEREQSTRVEVHSAGEHGPKTGPNEMGCAMEARLERQQPPAVTFDAAPVQP